MITFAILELDIFESLSRICVVTSIKICSLEIEVEVYIENEGWRKESGFDKTCMNPALCRAPFSLIFCPTASRENHSTFTSLTNKLETNRENRARDD
jgi:hypothetical protein